MESPHRLYLSKDKEQVYIDNCNEPQHMDCIRFLYRLFKKNKPGAIVNDPIGFDKDVQIVLFLKAVCHLLDKTILVLCPEGTEHDWLEMFRTWTDLGDDVVIEGAKQYLKKKVIINGMMNLPSFSQQNWSIVIVTDDSLSSNVLKYTLKADFKIWNTSVNMKKNLAAFSSIYTWLNQGKIKSKNPVEKFNTSDFTPDRKNISDVIDKAVRLDAFMEDIVIRRIKANRNLLEIKNIPPPKIVSKKNKDATGTKIKRSKRKIQDADTIINYIENVESTGPKLSKPSDENREDNIESNSVRDPDASDKQDPTFVQESSLVDNLLVKELKSTVFSQDSDIKLVYEDDTMSENDAIYEMNTLVDDDMSTVNINDDIDHDNNQMECSYGCVLETTKTNELNKIFNSNKAIWKVTNIDIQSGDDQSQESEAGEVSCIGHVPDRKRSEATEELVTEINENQAVNQLDKSNDIMESENEVTAVNKLSLTEDCATSEVSVNDNEVKVTSDVNELSVKEDLDDFDLKNNEYKEQAMKRFKGSVLDSIF